jgi:histone-lysine N-methyltransferase SETMAR
VTQTVSLEDNTGGGGREITADHPPHSPDLAHSDFHLFLHLKKHLAGQKFREDEEVKSEVTAWLCAQAAEFCDIGIQNLVPRLNRCLDRGGDYVEK